ncbi:MAG: ferrous iron transport protein A [Gemmatimonadetes bacterium]|nr:ferrous iron transport protein A [Gemmatimonadota bacterium]
MVVEFPLHFMRQGERGRVVGIRWREEDVERRLVEMGFEKGVAFEVVEFDEEHGITVRLEDRELTLVPWLAPVIYATEDPVE